MILNSKHPTPNDIKEPLNVFRANLDWYLVDWTQALNTIEGTKTVTDTGQLSCHGRRRNRLNTGT
jgi:hypothetical protein